MAVSGPDEQPGLAPQRWHSLRAFRNGSFRHLWAGIIVNGFAIWMNRLTVGWFVFDQTDSATDSRCPLRALRETSGTLLGNLQPFNNALHGFGNIFYTDVL